MGLKRVGALAMIDLEVMCDQRGMDSIPHPFAHLHPSPFSNLDEYHSYSSTVPDRLNYGDLQELKLWFESYREADLRVECVVSIVGALRERILAHRLGDLGFVAIQRSEDRLVEVYSVSPFDLGAAIAGLVGLTKPGAHPKIVIPEFRKKQSAEHGNDDGTFTIRHEKAPSPTMLAIPREKVLRYGRVQSRWQPARQWGFDREKNIAVWLHIADDGDYLYSPNFTFLTPMKGLNLRERIDQLIAEDVAIIRQMRRS
ncbi:hypothetical protein JNN96_36945 [Mycobacterium sp. DSM 3803]|nr:hypothetical protein [Mycobacterium sp. DSM 3803]